MPDAVEGDSSGTIKFFPIFDQELVDRHNFGGVEEAYKGARNPTRSFKEERDT